MTGSHGAHSFPVAESGRDEQLGADAFDLATRDVCAGWLDDPVAAVRAAAVDTLARLAPTLGAASPSTCTRPEAMCSAHSSALECAYAADRTSSRARAASRERTRWR